MKRHPAIVLALALSLGCSATPPPVQPGVTVAAVDHLALGAEQTYVTIRETANLLFVIEDENEAVIEAQLPGTHKLVEKIRVRVRADLPKFLRAIDTYKAARDAGKSDLLIALALGEQLLAEVQTILANSQKVVNP